MIDILTELDAIRRRVHAGERGDELAVRLQRRYPAPPEDVWDAVTDPERLARWFLPVTGDLRVGGRFATEGNADGEILTCEPPSLLGITWGAAESVVTVHLSPEDGDRTLLVLEHVVPAAMVPDASGALYVGPGWDAGLLALGLYLAGADLPADPTDLHNSPEVLEFEGGSVGRWADAVRTSALATEEQITESVAVATQQFTIAPGAAQ